MTKYSTGQNSSAEQWESDRRYVMWSCTCKPFDYHRHGHKSVEFRIVVEYSVGVGVDLILEARSDDTGEFADDWEPVETIEVRDYGVRHDRRPNKRWLE